MSRPRSCSLAVVAGLAALLAACSIPQSNFQASPDSGTDFQPPGVDHQVIKLSVPSLAIPEGSTGMFGVSLMFDPGGPVTVNLMDDNTSALRIGTTSIPFNSTDPFPVWRKISPSFEKVDPASCAMRNPL